MSVGATWSRSSKPFIVPYARGRRVQGRDAFPDQADIVLAARRLWVIGGVGMSMYREAICLPSGKHEQNGYHGYHGYRLIKKSMRLAGVDGYHASGASCGSRESPDF
jgi:hypothetical protein